MREDLSSVSVWPYLCFFQSIFHEMLCAIGRYFLKHTSHQQTSKYAGVATARLKSGCFLPGRRLRVVGSWDAHAVTRTCHEKCRTDTGHDWHELLYLSVVLLVFLSCVLHQIWFLGWSFEQWHNYLILYTCKSKDECFCFVEQTGTVHIVCTEIPLSYAYVSIWRCNCLYA